MSIDPTKSGGNPLSGPRFDLGGGTLSAGQCGQVMPTPSQTARDPGYGDDRGSLSPGAPAAGGAEAGTSPTGLPAERLRSILKRISSNYYDTPQVRDRIAQKLQSEFRTTPTQ